MVESGYIMEKPEICPEAIYEIMKQCWNLDPLQRPTMTEIGKRIGGLYRESVKIGLKQESYSMSNTNNEPLYNAV